MMVLEDISTPPSEDRDSPSEHLAAGEARMAGTCASTSTRPDRGRSLARISGWTQLGFDVAGEAGEDDFGFVSLSGNGMYVAIGAPENDGVGSNAGHVRIMNLQYRNQPPPPPPPPAV